MMNINISKLANQAGFDVDPTGKFGNYSEMHKVEKLAELIVKECLTFVEPMPGSGDIDDLVLEGAYNQIKEHFGVE